MFDDDFEDTDEDEANEDEFAGEVALQRDERQAQRVSVHLEFSPQQKLTIPYADGSEEKGQGYLSAQSSFAPQALRPHQVSE